MAAAGPSSSAPPRPGAGVATMVAGRRGDSAAGGRGALHGRRGAAAVVADVVETKLATTAADCGSCRDAGPRHCSGCERRARDAFLHDASDPRVALHLRSASPRPDLDVWRLVALASDGGGWTGVAVAVAVAMAMVADGGGCGSDGGGYRRCYLWRRWLKAIIRLTVRHRRR
uniref:Uncharacterized protein n=1 Tax=Oryza sativa subsp. japonica TaxID=39947 RepID=Q6K3G1_ORYSJ|nr:hypothetical protein [Oryza sativa Japonica Group]BAD22379.1 hypothetical protein [Oryza sativa Japonica Group]